MPKRLVLASNSTNSNYGEGYLDYCAEEIHDLLHAVNRILLIPYALRDHDAFLQRARNRFAKMDIGVDSVHQAKDPTRAVQEAEALFIGGGNTFRLLDCVYKLDLLPAILNKIEQGFPYVGSSAGSILAGPSIRTTNDMPIVQPPSFDALGVLPFHINPHYIDPLPQQFYHGESREIRLLEFLQENDQTVLAMREGAMLRIEWPEIILKGPGGARLFQRHTSPEEIAPGTALSYLISVDRPD